MGQLSDQVGYGSAIALSRNQSVQSGDRSEVRRAGKTIWRKMTTYHGHKYKQVINNHWNKASPRQHGIKPSFWPVIWSSPEGALCGGLEKPGPVRPERARGQWRAAGDYGERTKGGEGGEARVRSWPTLGWPVAWEVVWFGFDKIS